MADAGFVIQWGALALVNIALAFLVGGVRPLRVPNLLASVLMLFNGLLGLWVVFNEVRFEYGVLLSDQWGRASSWIQWLLNVPTLATLAIFPLFFPRRLLSRRGERITLTVVGSLIVLNLVISIPTIFDPEIQWAGNNLYGFSWGRYTAFLPFFVALAVGTVILLHTYITTPSEIIRTQARFVLAAYAFKATTYLNAAWVEFFASPQHAAAERSMAVLYAIPLGLAALVVPVTLVWSRLRTLWSPAPQRRWADDGFVLFFPALLLVILYDVELGTLEYMLIRPLLFAYAILRYQMLDVDIRNRRGTIAFTILAIIGAVYVVTAHNLDRHAVQPGVAAGVAFTLAIAAAGLLVWPLARTLLVPGPEEVENRDRLLYRAALEQAVVAEKAHRSTDHKILRALRERLQISEREHAALEASVRAMFGGKGVDPAVGQVFLGRYRVASVLGEGGFGRTFLADDERVGRRVVIKAARLETRSEAKRVLREARLLARLQDPHIVTIYDVEEVAGSVFLVLEYVEGGNLEQRLHAGKLPPEHALRIADDVLAGLEAAHAEGVIHRDIKPANILLTKDGRAKLADFGVAKAPAGSGTASGGLSLPGEHPGSLHFMSPEQVRGVKLDARSDLYSVGVVLYEALAGRPYLDFSGRTDFDARLAILEEPPLLPVEGVSAPVNDVVRRLLSKDPARRPASAEQARRLLTGAGAADARAL